MTALARLRGLGASFSLSDGKLVAKDIGGYEREVKQFKAHITERLQEEQKRGYVAFADHPSCWWMHETIASLGRLKHGGVLPDVCDRCTKTVQAAWDRAMAGEQIERVVAEMYTAAFLRDIEEIARASGAEAVYQGRELREVAQRILAAPIIDQGAFD